MNDGENVARPFNSILIFCYAFHSYIQSSISIQHIGCEPVIVQYNTVN